MGRPGGACDFCSGRKNRGFPVGQCEHCGRSVCSRHARYVEENGKIVLVCIRELDQAKERKSIRVAW